MTADLSRETVDLEILLPEGAKVQVKVGDKVDSEKIIAVCEGKTKQFDLSRLLGIPGKKVGKHLLISLGGKVKKGQIVAEKKGFFKRNFFKSPITGILEALSEKGILKIKQDLKKEIKTPTKGKVTQVKADKILIETPAVTLTGNWAVGESPWGQVKIVSSKEKSDLSDLGDEGQDKVLVFKGKIPCALIYKAEALGAVGLVVGGADRQAKPDQLAILSLGEEKGIIPDGLWKNLAKFERMKARILGKKNLLVVSY